MYIHENPVKAGIIEHPEDYIYSSARNYSGYKLSIKNTVLKLLMILKFLLL